MAQRVADLSTEEFEALVGRAIERRLQVWFTQVMDAIDSRDDEDESEMRPEFAAALQRSRGQARRTATTDLLSFRATIGR